MNKQQTAVEWLIEQLRINENIRWKGTPFFELSEQAKEMEKEQIIKAASDHCYPTCELATIDAEQYYNETYGGNK
jgi:hypothetical protein